MRQQKRSLPMIGLEQFSVPGVRLRKVAGTRAVWLERQTDWPDRRMLNQGQMNIIIMNKVGKGILI